MIPFDRNAGYFLKGNQKEYRTYAWHYFVGTPQDSGISLQTVLELGPVVPLFGVCMGLQCIGEAFGGAPFLTKACANGISVGSFF